MHLLSIRWHVHFFVTLRVKAGFYFILLYNFANEQTAHTLHTQISTIGRVRYSLRQSQQPSI